MTLRFERFRYFPENGKTITLFLGAVLGLIVCFIDLHNLKETHAFWSIFWISLLFDIITILVLLKDWDENVDWLRKAPYSLWHSLLSLVISFLMFMAGVYFMSMESQSGESAMYVAAFFCFLIFGIRIACVLKTFPQLKQDLHFPGRPTNSHYENEGTAIA
ncbi:hypothetical protein L5515_014175 [Caenorhabditis briggsae]|uniref:Uncharacterized protein n=1 Tax=Caenorhabditis briggsae TaxID=6238 RepID=A0AAE9DL05_CAEBR|nr:hypothetical protein L3Y34_018056 [Caenorhabditis briggsae]UMM17809.1 hypothetical protein L5515_014175 [Caenorhabditis briggsae]